LKKQTKGTNAIMANVPFVCRPSLLNLLHQLRLQYTIPLAMLRYPINERCEERCIGTLIAGEQHACRLRPVASCLMSRTGGN
jgi:hypothetical protein